MPIQTSQIVVESPFGVTIRNAFMTQDSEKLMILLPGRGYLNAHPVLHYVAKLGMQLGYDVLAVQYGFQVAGVDLPPEKLPLVVQDVNGAVEPVLKRGYRQVVIVGKSMGTPIAVEVAKTLPPQQVSLILLTPVGRAMQDIGSLRTLAIIGTVDAAYSAEEVALFDRVATVAWRVFDGLNHGLEIADNWLESVWALEDIIGACEEFLTERTDS